MLKQVVHIFAKIPLGLVKHSDYVLRVSLCMLPTQLMYVKLCMRFSWMWRLIWWYKCISISEKAESSTFMVDVVGNRFFRNVFFSDYTASHSRNTTLRTLFLVFHVMLLFLYAIGRFIINFRIGRVAQIKCRLSVATDFWFCRATYFPF